MKRSLWLTGAAVLVALPAALAAWNAGGLLDRGGSRIVEVRSEPFLRAVDAEGEVRSSNRVLIGCPAIPRMWNFSIAHLAPEGQQVRAGMPLVSFDSKKFQEDLQVKSSELDTTRKKLEKTRLEEQEKLEALLLELAEIEAKKVRIGRKLAVPSELLERIELDKLRLDSGLADEEIRLTGLRIDNQRRNMESRIRASESKVARLERRVGQLAESIQRMTVTAPRDGFVVHLPDWNGEKPKVGESVWVGRSIMEVADLTQMEVAAEVAEPDAGYVAVGQQVEIRLDASPDRLFKGRVERLGRLFRTKSHDVPSIVFDAVISIAEADPELMRPGMAAELKIQSVTEEPVLKIPEEALHFTDEGPTVEVERRGGAEAVAVKLGPRWDGHVVVEDGLEDGDRVKVGSHGS